MYGDGDAKSCALESRLERRNERLFLLVGDDGDAGDVGAVMVSGATSSPLCQWFTLTTNGTQWISWGHEQSPELRAFIECVARRVYKVIRVQECSIRKDEGSRTGVNQMAQAA